MSALNSSAVWGLTAEGERLFHCGIVRGKKEFFRASLFVWYLQYWALCDDLVDFQTASRGQVLVFFYRHTTRMYLMKEKQGGLIPTNPGRFAPDPVRPLDVAPQRRFAPGRLAPGRFAP